MASNENDDADTEEDEKPEPPKRTTMKGKNRYRAAARLVLEHIAWMKELDDELPENVKINLLYLKRKKDKRAVFSVKEIQVLMKPFEVREQHEKDMLSSMVKGLQCFQRYPEDVQCKLAERFYFKFYGPNRVIVKQDREALGVYFILSGQVAIMLESLDPVTSEVESTQTGLMNPGDTFGEVSLLHGVPRIATILTITNCELLFIEKKDFNEVLDATIRIQWNQTKEAMERFPYFYGWSKVAFQECCMLSKIKTYEPNDIILGCKAHNNYVYFVLKGSCQMIQHLNLLVKETKKGHYSYRLYYPDMHFEGKETLETHYMQVCILSEGASFGLGENLKDRRVIAITEVECLRCPRHWLMQNNKANIWVRIIRFMDRRLPSTQEVFQSFIENRKWQKHCRNLVVDCLQNRHIQNDTSISDVPYSIRINQFYTKD